MNLEALAREAGFDPAPFDDPDGYDGGAELARFKRFAESIVEACAKAVKSEHVGIGIQDECTCEGDAAYNAALRQAIKTIRALLREGE